MITARAGITLVEVLMAGLIFLLALVPTIGLMGTSQREVVKVQERMLAMNLAVAMTEEMRARRPADRASYPAAEPAGFAFFAPLIAAHKAAVPAAGPGIDTMMANFRCAAVVTPSAAGQPATVRATVTWTEGGRPQTLTFTAAMEQP